MPNYLPSCGYENQPNPTGSTAEKATPRPAGGARRGVGKRVGDKEQWLAYLESLGSDGVKIVF